MAAYLPQDWMLVFLCASLMPLVLLLGFLCTRIRSRLGARLAAWGLVLGGFGATEWLCVYEPAGLRMLLFCGVVLFAMKAVVAVEVRIAKGLRLTPVAWLRWAAFWPGMRPSLFAYPSLADRRGARALLLRGAGWLTLGFGLLLLARWVWQSTNSLVASSILLLPGLSLILHFGIFNLLAGFWRAQGFETDRLFPAPLLSVRLSEFWGKRWNLPFTEMIQRAIYRPLAAHLPRSYAAFAGFVFSGLLHEMAISVPVHRGYGLPMLYFLLHGSLVTIERKILDPQEFFTNRPWLGHLWTLLWLALPMPILFHPAFLRGILWPILGIS